MGVLQDPRWRSGAVMAAVVAAAGVSAHLTLRPSSGGPAPSPAVLAVALVVLAALLWPLATRTTRVPALTAVFALAQFAPRAVGVVLGGDADLRSLVCCPPAERVRPGPLGELTAQAGWALAGAQLVACLLLAVAVRGGRAAIDAVALAGVAVRGAWARARLVPVFALLGLSVPPAGGPRRTTPPPPPAVRLCGRVVAAPIARRGPPAAGRHLRSGAAHSRRPVLTAAG